MAEAINSSEQSYYGSHEAVGSFEMPEKTRERLERADRVISGLEDVARQQGIEGRDEINSFVDNEVADLSREAFSQESSEVHREAVGLGMRETSQLGDQPRTAEALTRYASDEDLRDGMREATEGGGYTEKEIAEIHREFDRAMEEMVRDQGEITVTAGQAIDSAPGWEQIDQSMVAEPAGTPEDNMTYIEHNGQTVAVPPKPEYAPRVERMEQRELSPTERTVEAAKERAAEMAERGIERSDFDGEAVEQAIESYYGDQEVTLSVLESFGGVPSDEQLAEIRQLRNQDELGVESEVYNQVFTALETASSEEERRDVMEAAIRLSYTEPCVGQLSLEAGDIQAIAERKQALLGGINPDKTNAYSDTVDFQVKQIEEAQEVALNEVRPAGQLLFHNTGFGRAIEDRGGGLRGRFSQEQAYGDSHKATADKEGHSQLIHFSEMYDPFNYKGSEQDDGAVSRSETYAIPLAKVIENAPVAAGLEMATVTKKAESSFVPRERRGANVGAIGAGEMQQVGSDTFSKDRVFWANESSQALAADYAIPLNAKEVYVLQSSYDRENSSEAVSNDLYVKALGVELSEEVSPDALSQGDILSMGYRDLREELQRYDMPADVSADKWGQPGARKLRDQVTEHLREKVTSYRGPEAAYTYVDLGDEKMSYGAHNERIAAIMDESQQRYEGQMVVPLRASGKDFVYRGSGDGFVGEDNAVSGAFADKVARMKYQQHNKQFAHL